jgi:hypothetical protein
MDSLLNENQPNLVPQVHPYAKMALGALSCAAKVYFHFLSLSLLLLLSNHVQIILAQVYRDIAVLKLLDKLSEVYSFIAQAQHEMRGEMSPMHAILGKISQQARECARFIKNYSETKKICES